MNLNSEQTAAVKSWLQQGKKISEVQSLLSAEFGLSMTYMDLRFLIDDLGIELQRPAEPEKTPEPEIESAPKGVSIDMDKISRPGVMASGSVVFSDGVKALWEIDQYGRFGLKAEAGDDYRPSEEDMMNFQHQLRQRLGA